MRKLFISYKLISIGLIAMFSAFALASGTRSVMTTDLSCQGRAKDHSGVLFLIKSDESGSKVIYEGTTIANPEKLSITSDGQAYIQQNFEKLQPSDEGGYALRLDGEGLSDVFNGQTKDVHLRGWLALSDATYALDCEGTLTPVN